ncbi:MAG: phytoene desaturase family protein [Gaiellaceae bacterium]
MSYDVVFIGSGINSLAGAALLARAGRRVLVLERNDYLGGAIKTAEITEPGFTHEVFSSWHPLFIGSAAYAELGDELHARGLEYLNTELATGSLFPDGESIFLTTSHEANVEELDRHAAGDGAAWDRTVAEFMPNADLAFGVLETELWSSAGAGLGLKAYRRLGRRGLVEFAGGVLSTCRDWVSETFAAPQAHGLLAPWVLHTGVGPDAASSGFMTRVIAVAIELGGMPVPRGGGVALVEALAEIVRDAGGALETARAVERIVVCEGRATGVVAGGETVEATEAVIANVTPTQLYERLLEGTSAASAATVPARRFRYGRAGMQIHMALREAPKWAGDERLARTAIVHLTAGLDGVSRAVNEADRGLLPAEATIVCGQPTVVDPARAPEGASILWIQLQELPTRVKGDAAGELDVGDGTWTDDLRERYADRIQARLARQIDNLDSALLKRVTLSPADIEAANVNMVGGDIYSGSCALDQNLVWRPRATAPGHRTALPGLYHIGASSHPGPGLGAGSGTLVARELLRPGLAQRARKLAGRG